MNCASKSLNFGRSALNKFKNAEKNSVRSLGMQSVSTPKSGGHEITQAQRPDWNRAVSEAEKIVGYPTSFLSLRWLLSDEIANVALHLRKLVGSNHPLLKTAKSLIYSGRNNVQAWGLIVLLISKSAGHLLVEDIDIDKAAGVLHSQRALAEVTEMIRTSHLVHKGLVNMHAKMSPTRQTVELNDMLFGNKIALLSGDYLLGNCCAELAALRNQNVIEVVSAAIRDLAEGEFVGRRDSQNNPLPPKFEKPSTPISDDNLLMKSAAIRDWRHRNILSAASLLGAACQGTLILAGHGANLQKQAYEFGKHLALASQACLDVEPFTEGMNSRYTIGEMFNLTSAPVMIHLEHDPSLYQEIQKGEHSVEDVDYTKIHEAVRCGKGVKLTKRLQKEHSQQAMKVLQSSFQKSDARTALANILEAMGEF